jgi:hypothetical protein
MKRGLIISSAFIVFVFSQTTAAQTRWGAISGKPAGRVLLISDIHFDPLADVSILEDLTKDPADQWEGSTNYPLLKSALYAAKAQGPYDFVIASSEKRKNSD